MCDSISSACCSPAITLLALDGDPRQATLYMCTCRSFEHRREIGHVRTMRRIHETCKHQISRLCDLHVYPQLVAFYHQLRSFSLVEPHIATN